MVKLLTSVALFLAICLTVQLCSAESPQISSGKRANLCRYERQNSRTRYCGYGNIRACQFSGWSQEPRPRFYYDCCPGWTGKGRFGCLKRTCIALPQNAKYTTCSKERKTFLAGENVFYKLTTPLEKPLDYPNQTDDVREAVPFPLLDQQPPTVIGRSVLIPDLHEQDWVARYIGMSARNNLMAAQTLKNIEPFTKYSDYAELLKTFRDAQPKDILSFKIPGLDKEFDLVNMDRYMRYPSQELPFKDIINSERWQDDDVFVHQRLAGLNTMVLRKMTHEDFKQDYVNRNYDWDEAMRRATRKRSTFKSMIDAGRVFIIDYKLLYDVANVDDLTELNTTDRREMRGSRSPFCVFVVTSWRHVNKLKPVAIQTDLRSDAPVRSPIDGSKWLLAKMEIQRADITHAQLVEHLLKTHLLMEPICVIMRRTLSKYHPIHQIWKWHCRGLFVTNSLGIGALLEINAALHKLFSIGHIGGIDVLNNAYHSLSWDVTEFDENLKRRGVDDRILLPYFPYRDDGMLSWRAVGNFAKEYVNLYYRSDADVLADYELANFANQLSADGTGKDGGIGMFKGFPSKIRTKKHLIDVFKRIVFIPIQHHSVNYPVAYYGGFVPNLPTKLYNDPRVPPQQFGFDTLPQSHVATETVALSMTLGSMRYDVIFDYGKHLEDDRARAVVEKFHLRFVTRIQNIITKRNENRLKYGKMSYPYLLPKWMPNSIHT